MLDAFLLKLKEILSSRIVYLSIVVFVLFSILVGRMYSLQILSAELNENSVTSDSAYQNYRLRYNESTRGNIYDRNGNLLAYNVLSYNIVMSNDANYKDNNERNTMIHKLLEIIDRKGYELELDFAIELDENGEFVFNISGNALLRFKKNAYGLTSVNKLTQEQTDATAEEVYLFMKNGNKASPMFGISDDYPVEEALRIMTVRYALFTLYPQYSQFTVCSNVDDVTIAAIEENASQLKGVEIKQVTSRVYNDSIFFAHILGYTGKATEDEAAALNEGFEDPMYNTSSVVGKTGIEKEMDSVLRGQSGVEELSVSASNKVLSTTVRSNPVAGDDIYLTIDRELQIACYHILENNIAAILISKIVNSNSYGGKGTSASRITIPIYEVYNAFIANSVLDISHFGAEDATSLEQKTYGTFLQKQDAVYGRLNEILSYDDPVADGKLSDEYKGYTSFIYSILRSDAILLKELIDQKDSYYTRYADGKVSLAEFLKYAIDMQWVDLSKLGIGSDYNTNREVYDKLVAYVFDRLDGNVEFERMLYKILIFSYKLSGKDICLLLYDQHILDYNESDYKRLANGRISAYNFVIEKLTNLEITPGMLALEPCSGSIVITDVKTGDVLAMVTYPSYDNNMLANKIDWKYYSSLLANTATPLMNRPTQQQTATGSTFKPLMSLAGLAEGVITTQTRIQDKGLFELVEPSPKCWKYPGNHGWINLTQAIQHSCNYFFYQVGYEMSLDGNGVYSDSLGISKIQKYASMFGLADKSGVEVPEVNPAISSTDAVRTSIGYYHNFTPVQISRYVTAVANKGTVYDLTIVDKTVNKESSEETDNSAEVFNQIDIYTDNQWNAVQKGMYDVVNTSANSLNTLYGDLGFKVAGKTGTAQVSLTHPSHGLFISFAPFNDPQVSVTVVIPNGYASANAAKLAREVYGLYFNDENKEELLSGDLTTTNVTNITVSD